MVLSEQPISLPETIANPAAASRGRQGNAPRKASKERMEEDSNEPVLQLSVGVPAWGIQKNLKLTLTAGSFRRVHQRLERFANEAAEREGAVTFNRPSPEERIELELACSKEFDGLLRRFEAAKELQKSRKSNGGAVVEENAQGKRRTSQGGVDQAPLTAWTDANDPVNSAIEQLRNRAEQLKAQIADAEKSLELAEQRRAAAENRLKQRMATDRKSEVATQTDPEEVELSLPGPVQCVTPSLNDIDGLLQPVSDMLLRDKL
jgi:hypothetical protein